VTHSIWDQTWHILTLANRPYFLICLFYLIFNKKLHTQFLKFLPPPWVLKCSKKNLRKWTWKQEKMTKIFVFSNDFELFYHFGKLRKIYVQKINRLIVSSINRFFVNFSSIFMGSCFLLGKVVSPNMRNS
jgi:hypothetical protein